MMKLVVVSDLSPAALVRTTFLGGVGGYAVHPVGIAGAGRSAHVEPGYCFTIVGTPDVTNPDVGGSRIDELERGGVRYLHFPVVSKIYAGVVTVLGQSFSSSVWKEQALPIAVLLLWLSHEISESPNSDPLRVIGQRLWQATQCDGFPDALGWVAWDAPSEALIWGPADASAGPVGCWRNPGARTEPALASVAKASTTHRPHPGPVRGLFPVDSALKGPGV